MKFTKMHGAGNDYVYVDCTKGDIADPSQTAIKVSDRHFGIGSDGLILIKKSEKADFFMEMYNADGSQGRMCGNGIRCVGKYVYDNGLTDKTTLKVDTLSGIKTLELHTGTDGLVDYVKVDMGAPILEPSQVPVDVSYFKDYDGDASGKVKYHTDNSPVISRGLEVAGKEYKVTCVSMGNPHAVVYLDGNEDIHALEIEKIGPAFEHHKAFPEQINTEFIQVVDRDNLNMRVWERGSAETLACGTGCCASMVATVMNGLCNDSVTMHLLGGEVRVTWDRDKNTVYMEGPAVTVFKGEMEI